MNRLLLLLLRWLIPVVVSAQNIPRQLDWPGFIGNPLAKTILLDRADSAEVVTVVAYSDKLTSQRLPTSQQPAVSRAGRAVIVAWSAAQTRTMNAQNYVEVSWTGVVRLYGILTLSKTTLPGSATAVALVNYVAPLPATFSPSGLTKFYTLENITSGHVLPHSGASRLLVGDCYPSDRNVADPLWKVEAFDDNTCVLRGPPLETFSGTVVVTVFQKLTN